MLEDKRLLKSTNFCSAHIIFFIPQNFNVNAGVLNLNNQSQVTSTHEMFLLGKIIPPSAPQFPVDFSMVTASFCFLLSFAIVNLIFGFFVNCWPDGQEQSKIYEDVNLNCRNF